MRQAANRVRVAGATGYDPVRTLLGPVLPVAAVLKGHQLATEPVAAMPGLPVPRFLGG